MPKLSSTELKGILAGERSDALSAQAAARLSDDRAKAMDYYLATVADAFEAGVVPRCHLEDITRADFYGFVVPFDFAFSYYSFKDRIGDVDMKQVSFSTLPA